MSSGRAVREAGCGDEVEERRKRPRACCLLGEWNSRVTSREASAGSVMGSAHWSVTE